MKYNSPFEPDETLGKPFKTYMRFKQSTITVTVPLHVAMDEAREWIEQDLRDRGFAVVQEADERDGEE